MLPYKITIFSGADDDTGTEYTLEKAEPKILSLDELIEQKRQMGEEEKRKEKEQQIKNLKDILR